MNILSLVQEKLIEKLNLSGTFDIAIDFVLKELPRLIKENKKALAAALGLFIVAVLSFLYYISLIITTISIPLIEAHDNDRSMLIKIQKAIKSDTKFNTLNDAYAFGFFTGKSYNVAYSYDGNNNPRYKLTNKNECNHITKYKGRGKCFIQSSRVDNQLINNCTPIKNFISEIRSRAPGEIHIITCSTGFGSLAMPGYFRSIEVVIAGNNKDDVINFTKIHIKPILKSRFNIDKFEYVEYGELDDNDQINKDD